MKTSRIALLQALIKKEILQIVRDPSCILIAFVLPLILLLIFGYGLSLDAKHERTAVVLEDHGPLAQSLFTTLQATEYIDALPYPSREKAEEAIVNAKVRAVLIIPNDFSRRAKNGEQISVQLITDGCEANTATIIENYVQGTMNVWLQHQLRDRRISAMSRIELVPRVWFNAELNTRNALIPGSIVLIMAIIGTLLTALVVAREWERGTMEAMLATPIHKTDMIFGKLLPYYLLGMGSVATCVFLSRILFDIPFRGSIFPLFLASSAFLFVALLVGFFISTVTKNQFIASMASLILSFLPNYFLSGVLFEIDSMPLPLRMITYIFPARYYVTCLQTIFMVGDIWPLFIRNILCMLLLAALGSAVTLKVTPKRLE